MNEAERELLKKIDRRTIRLGKRAIRLEEQSKSTHTFIKSMNITNTNEHATLAGLQRETNKKVGVNESQISKIWGIFKGIGWGAGIVLFIIGLITKILEIW